MKRLALTFAALAVAVTAWAFVQEASYTTPATTNTTGTVSANLDNSGVAIAGTVQRAIVSVAGPVNATGTVMLIDFDGTVLLTTQLVTGASATITNTLPAFQPSLVLSNQTSTNLTGTATLTFQQ